MHETLNAPVRPDLLERLVDYSRTTGVPVTDCLTEALTDWLDCVAVSRLEALEAPDPELTLANTLGRKSFLHMASV